MLTTAITTTRLQLRVLNPEDAPLLQTYLLKNRTHLAPWEPARDDSFFELEQCQQRLFSSCLNIETGQSLALAVFLKNSSQIIGTCNFSNIVRGIFQACHLGYAIDAESEGQGYMMEAVQAGIQHMFQQQGLHRIMANHVPENIRSASLLKRLGFEQEGVAKSYLKINGVWRDHVLNSLVNLAD
ncbi:ribosomal-protein-alanine N-acetyltransferase [Undibacterium sp. GrIS 1.8]|uniref:GNAT family N-acetyltransferase n=1 Tax=Undibacterium sp. GrIS 1.8 TaxID=3143934 RepID=UPI0033995E16